MPNHFSIFPQNELPNMVFFIILQLFPSSNPLLSYWVLQIPQNVHFPYI
jgi:hypothetical protein